MGDLLDDGGVTREYEEEAHEASDSSSKASFNTMPHDTKRQRPEKTFTARMAFYFAFTAIMTAAILSAVLAVVWEGQFKEYARDNMQALAERTANNLSTQYRYAGEWNDDVLKYADYATNATSSVVVQVVDSAGDIIYDDTWDDSKRTVDSSRHISAKSEEPEDSDSVVTADVISDGAKVGEVRIWSVGSSPLLTKNDAAFRLNSYGAILGAAGVAVILACVVGYLASRALTKPIKVITSTATQIRNGDLTARTNLTGDDEIGRLGETFDSMASELERDIKFEHRLTSDVAHELRTPLMAMQATVEAMQDGVLPTDDEHFEIVAGEVRRLSRLVDAMLHLSRIENGTRELKIERADVVYLVKSLVSMQAQLFADKGLALRFDDKTTSHECYADIDPDLIREAVTNLMSNAMRYTPDGGWVVVSVARDRTKNEVLIAVQDTGIGIAKEDIPRVFSRFWRSDASRERVSGGLGVGPSLTKEIIEKHNGSISVESEPGKGTTFTLHIPIDHGHKSIKQQIQEAQDR